MMSITIKNAISRAVIFATALSVVLSGCVKEQAQEETQEELHEVVFHAGWDAETKTVLQGDGGVWWEPGDKISMFVDGAPTNYVLTSTIIEDAPKTDFVGEIAGGSTYYAVYPASENHTMNIDNTLSIDISGQIARKGTFSNAFVCVAKTTDNTLTFKHITGGVKFSVAKEGVRFVSFSKNDLEDIHSVLSGRFVVSFDENGEPVYVNREINGQNAVVYAPNFGTFEVGEYYYAVLPETLVPGGIEVRYQTDDEYAIWNDYNPFEVHRGKFKRLYNKDAELTYRKLTAEAIIGYDWMPDCVDRRTVTGIEFHVNDGTVTDNMLYDTDGLSPIYYEMDGTVLHLYTPADVIYMEDGADFRYCSALKELDLSNVRTTGRKNFFAMFGGCSRLEALDLSSFDTSSARNMEGMFSGCYNLKTLNLSGFNTAYVLNMSNMFATCQSLSELDLSSFSTANVTDMSYMFSGCSGLSNIDIHTFSTGKVRSMQSMFSNCNNLKSLDLSHFDTSNVTDMRGMFNSCSGLHSLNISNFNTEKVESMSDMFYALNLKSLDLSNFNTPNVTSVHFMFGRCEQLKELNISNFSSESLEDASLLFSGCSNLQKIDMGSFDLSGANCSGICGAMMTASKKCAIRCSAQTRSILEDVNDDELISRIQWFNLSEDISSYVHPKNPDLYYSTDFSKHETVRKIQSATVGKGIDIVLMGEAYSDRLIENGKYDSDMQLVVDAIFSKEPFASYKNYFNIYVLYLVSENEIVGESTALGSIVGGDPYLEGYAQANCYPYYRMLATGDPDITKSEAIVVVNCDVVSGYATMVFGPSTQSSSDDPNLHNCDYGYGTAWVVLGRGSDDASFSITAAHEIGHSFAKLADEYWKDDDKTIPSGEGDWFMNYLRPKYGIYKNIDITSDPDNIYWSNFLTDPRYNTDEVGVYEGGFLYGKGVWRASENSIMRHGTEFNAPSRAAIYNRIHKLAFGDSWQFDYETFVQQDLKNIQPAATKSAPAKFVPHPAKVNKKHLFKVEESTTPEGKKMITVIMD